MQESPHHMLVFGCPEEPIVPLFEECVSQGKCFAIVHHDPKKTPDIPSEYEVPHYHGLVRATGNDFGFERAWIRLRDQFRQKNIWFKATKVYSLPAVAAYLQMPGKTTVLNNLKGTTKEVWDAVSQDDIERQIEKKKEKHFDKKEDSDVINRLREYIIKTGLFTESEMLSECHNDRDFEKLYKMRTFTQSFDKAKNLAAQRILDEPLTGLFHLCEQREWPRDTFYTVDASVAIVSMIMEANKIPMAQFVQDSVDLMDRKRPKVNCLWFHGKTNAGKSYLARSFERLAILFHSVPPGSNRFMFQDCVNKRLIVLNEPYLDESSVEAVKEVLEGNGCYVPVKQKADQWLRATPVIITSNTVLWQFNSQARQPLLSRCFKGYMNMVSCEGLAKMKKELTLTTVL
jgi:hypothetical protein